MKDKEIKGLKKELAAQRKLTKELESAKVPTEELWKIKPLKEGMIVVKQKHIDQVLVAVQQFIGALERVAFEEQKLKYIIVERTSFLRILDSRRPMIMQFEMIRNRRPEDIKFCEEY